MLDEARIPEKRIKQIVTRVLGADVHINKTMLKVIGGIAKLWVADIVEEAKLIQVKEENEFRENLGLNDRIRNANKSPVKDIEVGEDEDKDENQQTLQKEVQEQDGEGEDQDNNKDEDNDKDEENDKDEDNNNDSPSRKSQDDNEEDKDEENKEDEEDLDSEAQSDIIRQTLFSEKPLMPYHLRMAREEYERKREKSKMIIF